MRVKQEIVQGDAADVLSRLPDNTYHCCVTSPPYWNLRDYGAAGQIGLEATPDEYLAKMVAVFREVRRVLRKDGTAWVNVGDSYASGGHGGHSEQSETFHGHRIRNGDRQPKKAPPGFKPKDLIGIPWRLAFALQADGWWLRSDVIWSKQCPMPSSVKDRPTVSHEYIFLLTTSARYHYDQEACRVPVAEATVSREKYTRVNDAEGEQYSTRHDHESNSNPRGRNLWTVWSDLSPTFVKEAHFATFPESLVERCLLLGTSPEGCCAHCGAPYVRETDIWYENEGNRTTNGPRNLDRRHESAAYKQRLERRSVTTGFKAACDCNSGTARCRVLDPFMGSGTTAIVARRLNLDCTGIELSADYVRMATNRLEQVTPMLF